jgi:hypothetical protein
VRWASARPWGSSRLGAIVLGRRALAKKSLFTGIIHANGGAERLRLRPPDTSLKALEEGDLASVDVRVCKAMKLIEIPALPHPQAGARHVHRQVELLVPERVEGRHERRVDGPPVLPEQAPVDLDMSNPAIETVRVVGLPVPRFPPTGVRRAARVDGSAG